MQLCNSSPSLAHKLKDILQHSCRTSPRSTRIRCRQHRPSFVSRPSCRRTSTCNAGSYQRRTDSLSLRYRYWCIHRHRRRSHHRTLRQYLPARFHKAWECRLTSLPLSESTATNFPPCNLWSNRPRSTGCHHRTAHRFWWQVLSHRIQT